MDENGKEMCLNEKEKQVLWSGIRAFMYLLLTMGFIGFILYLSSIHKGHTFSENGIVENMQLSLLLLSGIIFFGQGMLAKDWRPLMFFLASLCFLAGCRELDKVLDELISGLRWRVGFIFPFTAIIYALKHKETSRQNLFLFIGSSPFYLMFTALIIIFPIAQCIGHRPLIINVLGGNQMAATKELFEECSEIMGYFLILLSSIESYISFVQTKNENLACKLF